MKLGIILGTQVLVALMLAGLTGCRSAETRIFTLTEVAGAPRVDWPGAPVRVDVVHVPPGLDRVEILTAVAPGELKIHDLAHWAAPLSQVVRQTLSIDLASRLPPGKVMSPHLPKPDGVLGISVDILDFSVDAAAGHLRASWDFSRDAATTRQQTVQLQAGPGGRDASAMAQSWSALLALLADRIAASSAEASP